MGRSWDARVRGASQKASFEPTGDERNDGQAAPAALEGAPGRSSRRRSKNSAPLPGLRAKSAADEFDAPAVDGGEGPDEAPTTSGAGDDAAETSGAEEHPFGTAPTGPDARRAEDAELVAEGLSMAVQATEMAVAVVERSTGLIRWTSDTWIERFGEKDLIARHMPTSTEFGESPLPPPGESWQRTRTLLFADGAERLIDLVMVGATAGTTDFVTVVALDRDTGGPVVAERGQVIDIIDGAIDEVADGSVAVLYLDLDRFKVVHDLVGNIEALRLLDLVHHRLAATVRGTDLLFRLHSDEFVVVACELEHPAAAEELADRLRGAVATLSDVGHDMALTASIGVAIAEDEQNGETLLSAAETAVYVAKGRGRNRVAVHDEEIRSRTQRLMVVERQLRQAIDRKDVRFAYQPVVELASGKVIGAEALLRLGGDVGLSAVEVVAAAEHSGLMGALGVLVIDGVNEQLGSLLRVGESDQTIMINLSSTQLADDDLIRTLEAFVSDPTIPNGRLAVEVPELVVRDHRRAVNDLAASIRPAFKLGIDGFGSGVLKPEVLEGAPIDYVKLHRSVTNGLENQSGEDKIALARLIARAHEAGIDVVALGVESDDQASALMELGCRSAQGFLYAGAVTAEKLLQLMATGTTSPTPGWGA